MKFTCMIGIRSPYDLISLLSLLAQDRNLKILYSYSSLFPLLGSVYYIFYYVYFHMI